MRSTLSILGLYNFRTDIFDNMNLPTGVELDTVRNSILLECAELEVIYPDPDVMKMSIGLWSSIHVGIWEKLNNTTKFEYDPISNYDRNEEWKDTQETNGQSNSTNKAYVVGFNETTPAQSDETTSVGGFNGSGENTRKGRAWGNIGVTTTQQMIEEERRIVQFSVINHIVKEFKARFCLGVY